MGADAFNPFASSFRRGKMPSGSFKSRGIGNYVLQQMKKRGSGTPTHFYIASGGNAAIACVHAAKLLGQPTTVVVPARVKPHMVSKLKSTGAQKIIKHGDSILDADSYLKTELLGRDPSAVYVPPYDHQDIWTGNGTMVSEIAAQLGDKPDVVVCSVGGGGLLNGIVEVLDERNWTEEVEVLAIETKGADSLGESLRAGKLITLDKITSQATSLGVRRISDRTWEYAQRPQVKNVVLSDTVAGKGCYLFAQHERMLVELTAGVSVALCFDGLLETSLGRKVQPHEKVVIVVCGGNDINLDMLLEWRDASVAEPLSTDSRGTISAGEKVVSVVG